MADIHWFPGHMNKALHEIEERIKIVDIVIQVLDARAPFSSINPQFASKVKNKKVLTILAKTDLADSQKTQKWVEYFKKDYPLVLSLDLTKDSATKEISKAVNKLGEEKHNKDRAKGMKPQPIRVMIIGVPNVGKSSLINRLAKRKAAGVENKPGFTRGEQWIKVNNDFLLLDTPGILPMNYEDKTKATRLALLGSIREDILPHHDMALFLLNYLKAEYPYALKERFSIEEISDIDSVIKQICEVRKIVNNNESLVIEKAETILLKEFKDGLLGKISLE